MFRSENNVLGGAEEGLNRGDRQHHDFLDDLESFFWVYVWMIMVQNGPGEGAFLSEPCIFIVKDLKTKDLPHLHSAKYLYIRNLTWRNRAAITPYFSQSPYLELHGNLRSLFDEYRYPKQEGLDLFPQMDAIYRRFLGFFDSAIQQLGGMPQAGSTTSSPDVDLSVLQPVTKPASSVPLRRIQPDRLAKRPREGGGGATRQTKKARFTRPPPKRPAKRPADDDSSKSRIREPKRRKTTAPLPNPRPCSRKEDIEPPTSKTNCTFREGTRRSERIMQERVRDTANGERKGTMLKRRP